MKKNKKRLYFTGDFFHYLTNFLNKTLKFGFWYFFMFFQKNIENGNLENIGVRIVLIVTRSWGKGRILSWIYGWLKGWGCSWRTGRRTDRRTRWISNSKTHSFCSSCWNMTCKHQSEVYKHVHSKKKMIFEWEQILSMIFWNFIAGKFYTKINCRTRPKNCAYF